MRAGGWKGPSGMGKINGLEVLRMRAIRPCHAIDLRRAPLKAFDFLSSVAVRGRKAPKSICQQASPGSFDSAP
jgi:hypothetical protein